LEKFDDVLRKLTEAGLNPKPSKRDFSKSEVFYLSHVVSWRD